MGRGLSLAERWTFGVCAAALAAMALLLPLLVPAYNLLDFAIMAGAMGFLYALARQRSLPVWAYAAVFISFILHGAGVLGLFGTRFLDLGYDKWIHLTSGITFVLFFAAYLPLHRRWQRLAVAMLCMLGGVAINEAVEFSGSRYLGIEKGGLLAQGDGLPPSASPLIVYDTQFDILFNIAGGLIGLGLYPLLARGRKSHRVKIILTTPSFGEPFYPRRAREPEMKQR